MVISRKFLDSFLPCVAEQSFLCRGSLLYFQCIGRQPGVDIDLMMVRHVPVTPVREIQLHVGGISDRSGGGDPYSAKRNTVERKLSGRNRNNTTSFSGSTAKLSNANETSSTLSSSGPSQNLLVPNTVKDSLYALPGVRTSAGEFLGFFKPSLGLSGNA